MKLTVHLHVVLKLRVRGAILSFPPSFFMVWFLIKYSYNFTCTTVLVLFIYVYKSTNVSERAFVSRVQDMRVLHLGVQ